MKCFWLEPVDPPMERFWLRRYRSSLREDEPCPKMPGQYSYHQAMTLVGDGPAHYEDRTYSGTEKAYKVLVEDMQPPPRDDSRWPTLCICSFPFTPDDAWQLFSRQLYRRTDTGEVMTVEEAPVGALWNAWWMADVAGKHAVKDGVEVGGWLFANPDGLVIMCKTPGGEWCIDSRANNCTMPNDNNHHCWVRHGTPPDLHVDKNGATCQAGAGSIQCRGYHGFLHNGHLTDC